jgi:hypothetical protein
VSADPGVGVFETYQDAIRYIRAATGLEVTEADLQNALETGGLIGGMEILADYGPTRQPEPDNAADADIPAAKKPAPVYAPRVRDPLIRWPSGEAPLNWGIGRRWR